MDDQSNQNQNENQKQDQTRSGNAGEVVISRAFDVPNQGNTPDDQAPAPAGGDGTPSQSKTAPTIQMIQEAQNSLSEPRWREWCEDNGVNPDTGQFEG